MFDRSRRFRLDDGRQLVVEYQGERYGWGAYIPGGVEAETSAATPLGAMILFFGPGNLPSWAKEVSEGYMRALSECARHACDCCGYFTLLNVSRYENCVVCGWEDDRTDNNRVVGGPDVPSGPNGISLTEARANFAAFGASLERRLMVVRDPRPDERPLMLRTNPIRVRQRNRSLALAGMDRIEFVVAQYDLGNGPQICAEPVINGERLVDILAHAEGKPPGYAGLRPEKLRSALEPAPAADVQVLRCICGDDLCSWARVFVETRPDEVLWHDVQGSRGEADSYTGLGPYRFWRAEYERALAEPTQP